MERHRRKNLRKFGNSILYKLHNDNGTNSEGKTCKKYERKHIAQIGQERTAGSIKFGKDAKICHFAAKSTVISADSAKILHANYLRIYHQYYTSRSKNLQLKIFIIQI